MRQRNRLDSMSFVRTRPGFPLGTAEEFFQMSLNDTHCRSGHLPEDTAAELTRIIGRSQRSNNHCSRLSLPRPLYFPNRQILSRLLTQGSLAPRFLREPSAETSIIRISGLANGQLAAPDKIDTIRASDVFSRRPARLAGQYLNLGVSPNLNLLGA
jgi:hypothetical protein